MRQKILIVLLSGVICFLGVTSALAVNYNEAPMLRTLVAAGELPPVEERLPKEPLVVEPIEEIGEYGGTLHTAYPGPRHFEELELASERFLMVTESGLAPNLLKDYEFSKDGKTITLYFREGIRWSDGAPFTTDDLMFWYEDVLLNKELNPVLPRWYMPGGELLELKKIDDYTAQFGFVESYPMILTDLARSGVTDYFLPAHYLKQYHIKYNAKADEIAKQSGFDYWWQLFQQKSNLGSALGAMADPYAPVLKSYVLTEHGTNYIVAERNPYYWKVDTAGNQLPYIDRLVVSAVGSLETYNAKIVAGEVDLAGLNTELRNLVLYKEGEESGDYRVIFWSRVQGVDVAYQPNQTYKKDLVLGELFRDVRFRRALSLAIDREDINEALYLGLAVPRQTTVIPQSKYYEKEFGEAYAEFNLKEANRLLDEIGLEWDEDHEYRLRSDGKQLTIILEYTEGETPKTATSELVKEYWKEIGIDLLIRLVSGELLSVRVMANEVQMGLWHADRCGFLFDTEPFWFVNMYYGIAMNSYPLWSQWYYTDGEKGEEPPEELKENVRRWEIMKTTMDEEERVRLGKEILASQAENLWTIGTVGLAPQPIIVRNNLRNVPENAVLGWDYFWTLPQKPEQYFLKQPLLPSQK